MRIFPYQKLSLIITLFLVSNITSNHEYKQYTPRDAENLAIFPPLPCDIGFGNHPSWNIQHIPRAGAASGLNRPSGCVGYFIRDDSLIQYREILHSASPRVIFPDIQRYFVTRGCASRDKIPLNIGGNGGNIARLSASLGEYCIEHFLLLYI